MKKLIIFFLFFIFNIYLVLGGGDLETFIPYFGDTQLWYIIGDNQNVFLGVNLPPTFNQSLNDISIHHNVDLNYLVNCSDSEGDTIYYFDNTSLFNINSTGGIFDNPSQNENGTYNILINCGDDYGNNTDTFSYTIINDVPAYVTFSPTNLSIIGYNYTNITAQVSDTESDAITYEFYNGTSTSLTLLYNGTNHSINFTGLADGNYYWQVNITDGLDVNLSDIRKFTISTTNPAVNLKYPKDDWYYNNNLTRFNFTVYDSNGVDTCLLYGNWSDWLKNQTLRNPVNDALTENNFTDEIPLSDGGYFYNVWCNDTLGNSGFYIENYTFNIDTVYPAFKLTQPTSGQDFSTQTVIIKNNFTDINEYQCKFYIQNAIRKGAITTYSTDCNGQYSLNLGAWGTWTIYGSGEDLATNINTTSTFNFTTTELVTPPVTPPEEGGGAITVPLEEIVREVVGDICGDDICGKSENPWDCPEDCKWDLLDPETWRKAWVTRSFAWILAIWFIFATFLPRRKKKKKKKK